MFGWPEDTGECLNGAAPQIESLLQTPYHAGMRHRWRESMADLREATARLVEILGPQTSTAANDAPAVKPDLVTLDEAAAIVHRSKKTLERQKMKMPAPIVEGGGGKAALWNWSDLRPWLEKEYLPDLPVRFPRNVH